MNQNLTPRGGLAGWDRLPEYEDGVMAALMISDPEQLLQKARTGDASTLGHLLEQYRRYFRLLARLQIGRRLQAKVDESDVVQELFLDAHRHFAGFRGHTEAQLLAWLRKILATKLADVLRRFLGAEGRDVRLEHEIEDAIDRSSVLLDRGLVAPQSSPSQQAARREHAVLLADALAELPNDYREAIELRHLEGLTFPEVARRMGRSQDSVEKLWLRGLARLKQLLGGGT
jgi:RNA polymerase sigma-70 factor (ECF subfamily)